jgi:hypothetical protein
MYSTGSFSKLTLRAPNAVAFRFIGDADWSVGSVRPNTAADAFRCQAPGRLAAVGAASMVSRGGGGRWPDPEGGRGDAPSTRAAHRVPRRQRESSPFKPIGSNFFAASPPCPIAHRPSRRRHRSRRPHDWESSPRRVGVRVRCGLAAYRWPAPVRRRCARWAARFHAPPTGRVMVGL